MRPYRIREDCHYSNHFFIPKMWWNKKKWTIKFCFDSSCWWSTPRDTDDFDLNKLFGVCFGFFNHKNSIRFAWRPDFENKREILIYAYLYDPKSAKHESLLITKVKTGILYTAEIELRGDYYYMYVDGVTMTMPNKTKDCKLQFMQYPYFGGNNKAYRDMVIYLDEIAE